MEKNQDDFLKKLLETFKIEADEHIRAINNLLIKIEKQKNGPPKAEIIEEIFREMHSLKGGARSVNLMTVESLCSSLESIFSIWKNKSFFYSKLLFNNVHKGLSLLEKFLGTGFDDKSCEIEILEITQTIKETEIPLFNENEKPKQHVKPIQSEKKPEDANSIVLKNEPQKPQKGSFKVKDEIIRVNVSRLEGLLNHSEELITLRLKFEQHYSELEALLNEMSRFTKQCNSFQINDGVDILSEIVNGQTIQQNNLAEINSRYFTDLRNFQKEVNLLVTLVRESMLVPCSRLFEIYPKMVRDIASDMGKEVNLSITGENIEIDRRILDLLRDPVMHIIRNAIDHGIEKPHEREINNKTHQANISIAVNLVSGNKIEIRIEDDGRGIDLDNIKRALQKDNILAKEEIKKLTDKEILNAVFYSGLTTSKIITDISGRGLGLAIAYKAIESIGGKIDIETNLSKGTAFILTVPVSTSTSRGTFIECSGQQYIVPSLNVLRSLRLKKEEIRTIESKLAFFSGNRTISLVYLSDILGYNRSKDNGSPFLNVIVVEEKGKEIGFVVDSILHEQEIVVKPLGNLLKRVRFIKGVSIIGTGQVVPMLNPSDLFMAAITNNIGRSEIKGTGKKEAKTHKSVLIAEDSITSRMLLKDILESAGYKVQTSVDGAEALAYLRENKYDALISDIEMPRMNGFDLTINVRQDKRLADLPVILVTALKTREDREKGLEAGANAYIEKGGFNPENLLNTLEKLI